jgi:hypothetical protein
MNQHEQMNDSTLTRELRESLTGIAAPPRPPLATIAARGRAHRRHRRTGLAGLSAAGVAAGTALALGLTGVFGSAPARGTGTIQTAAAALTAVNGCAGLKQADGTLGQVTGTSLVIKTATGQPVTVTTTASTMVSLSRAPLSDITDGTQVMVAGPRSGGTIAAQHVIIGPPGGRHHLRPQVPPGTVAAQGAVADASTAGFTVITPGGTRIAVTTSSSTHVEILHASLSQPRTGAATIAVGYAGPHGTLSAIAVVQPPPGSHLRLQVKGCSATSVDGAITTALVTAG